MDKDECGFTREAMRISVEYQHEIRKFVLTEKQLTYLNLIKQHGPISARDLSDIFGLKIQNACTQLAALHNRNYLHRNGEEGEYTYSYAVQH